jgi:hypothetical protein
MYLGRFSGRDGCGLRLKNGDKVEARGFQWQESLMCPTRDSTPKEGGNKIKSSLNGFGEGRFAGLSLYSAPQSPQNLLVQAREYSEPGMLDHGQVKSL